MFPKALIFDVDGTLAETEELHRKAFNLTFKEFGLDWFWDQKLYGELLKVAGGQNRTRHFIETSNPADGPSFIDQVAEIHKRKTQKYGELLTAGEIELRPGIESLIAQAHKTGIKTAISTSTSRINVDRLFAATMGLDVLNKFDAVCCSNDVTSVKPASDLYLLALDQLELAPEECLAIEDSEIGLASAKGASVPVLITVSAYCRDDEFSGAWKIMDDLESGGFKLQISP